ncbi:MAG: TRAP transporter substrate-binding protein DctP [Eubacterium sp.]|nr:TRAP transporter substrate-binding protein DctP [Eubacterium sp.]
MKKIVSLLLTGAMLLSLCACGGSASSSGGSSDSSADATASNDETVTVSIQFTFPEESADGANKVLDQITEASGGRIQFEKYYSYSFVDTADVVDALQTNQLDMAGLMPTDYSIFSLNGRMCSLPLLNYPDWEAACKIYLSMIYNNEDMLAEFEDNGLKFYAGYMCPGYQFFCSEDITDTTPNTFNGLTVMCDNAEMQALINSYQGGAISVFPTDFLSNLQNGVAEALMQHVNCAYVFGCFDYVKSAMFFGEGGFYNFPLAFAMSDDFWNSLPEDLQQIFAEYADDFSRECYTADYALYSNVAYPALEEAADNIIMLDDAQIAEWQAACSDLVENAVTDIEQDSPNVRDALSQLKDMIANYDASSFSIGTTNFGTDVEW